MAKNLFPQPPMCSLHLPSQLSLGIIASTVSLHPSNRFSRGGCTIAAQFLHSIYHRLKTLLHITHMHFLPLSPSSHSPIAMRSITSFFFSGVAFEYCVRWQLSIAGVDWATMAFNTI